MQQYIVIIILLIMVAAVGIVSGQESPKPNPELKVGDKAPLFKLKSPDGKEATDLKSFWDRKPVVLFFGSYT